MGIIAATIIFLCLCVDNMVSANMTSTRLTSDNRNIFSIKVAFVFAVANGLFFGLGYLLSAVFHGWIFLTGHQWAAFALVLLLGIKFMLESIEKSPSFSNIDVNNGRKLFQVSALLGSNFLLAGYAAEVMGSAFFPQIIVLLVLSFGLTLLGFHLGVKNNKIFTSKKFEFVAGLLLVIMAIRFIIL